MTHAGTVEVDDVKRLGPFCDPTGRRHRRVIVEDGLARKVATFEANALAGPNIDGRDNNHGCLPAAMAAKLSSKRKPTAWLFSGWN